MVQNDSIFRQTSSQIAGSPLGLKFPSGRYLLLSMNNGFNTADFWSSNLPIFQITPNLVNRKILFGLPRTITEINIPPAFCIHAEFVQAPFVHMKSDNDATSKRTQRYCIWGGGGWWLSSQSYCLYLKRLVSKINEIKPFAGLWIHSRYAILVWHISNVPGVLSASKKGL